jgi:hypothetical protein
MPAEKKYAYVNKMQKMFCIRLFKSLFSVQIPGKEILRNLAAALISEVYEVKL